MESAQKLSLAYMVAIYHRMTETSMAKDQKPTSVKTTVYLDSDDYQKLKGLARAEGRSAAELVREAVAEYAQRQTSRLRPRSLGAGRSGRGDLSERAEDLLGDFGSEP